MASGLSITGFSTFSDLVRSFEVEASDPYDACEASDEGDEGDPETGLHTEDGDRTMFTNEDIYDARFGEDANPVRFFTQNGVKIDNLTKMTEYDHKGFSFYREQHNLVTQVTHKGDLQEDVQNAIYTVYALKVAS
tara:strand:- start:1163 stop:1567 length:405 start_codon:yes stop_codon:yes gene_type:complete